MKDFEVLDKAMRGPPGSLEVVECGEMNEVYVDVEQERVFRATRTDDGLASTDRMRDMAYASAVFGVELLTRLNKSDTLPPLSIPEHLDAVYDDGSKKLLSSQTLAPGERLSEQYIADHFSSGEKAEFGRSVAACAMWLSEVLPVEESKKLGRSNQLPSPHLEHWDRLSMVARAHETPNEWPKLRDHPSLLVAISRLKDEVEAQPGLAERNVFGHRDLRSDNFLFGKDEEDSWAPISWLDFDIAGPSNMAYELRFLPEVGEEAVLAAVERCSENGVDVNQEDIAYNNRVQSVSSALFGLELYGAISSYAHKGLSYGFPDLDWQEPQASES